MIWRNSAATHTGELHVSLPPWTSAAPRALPSRTGGPREAVAPEHLVRGGVSEAWPAARKHVPGQAFQHECPALTG